MNTEIVMTRICMAGIVSLEIGVLADLCLRLIDKYDPEESVRTDDMLYYNILMYCTAAGSFIGLFLTRWEWYGQLMLGILAAYLLAASIQDMQTCMVCDFLHITAAVPGIVLVVLCPSGERILSLVLFVIIQIGLFMRMYGVADGLAFCVCALFESRFGEGMLTYLLHMGLAFLVLGVVQGVGKNINKHGNLKKPVPFLPYIAATVWVFL